jgi:hypothetical protein
VEELELCAFSFFSCGHLFIGCLHVVGIAILVLAAGVGEDLFLVVVFSFSKVGGEFGLGVGVEVGAGGTVAGSIEVFLAVVEIVFEFFVEHHAVGIADSFVFLGGLSGRGRFETGQGVKFSGCGSVRAVEWGHDIFKLFVGLLEFFLVISLGRSGGTLMRLICCLFLSISSRAEG